MSADKSRASDRVRPGVVQALLDDPLDYCSYTIAECRVLQSELRRLDESEAALIGALEQIATQHGQWNNGMWAAGVARAAIAKTKGARRG